MDAIASHAPPFPHRGEGIGADRWVSIRPIERTDAPGLSDFYAGLSPESRRRRFLSSGRRSGAELARAFTQLDGEGFVAILRQRGPNDGAIVGHATFQPDGTGAAEVAFAVADELQGRGIGRLLMGAILAEARAAGLQRLNATLFANNAAMRRLLRGAEGSVVSDVIDTGVEEIVLAV
jgi:RimJ/RimL family protein N-acetyltransferase